jgi:protein phosphatase
MKFSRNSRTGLKSDKGPRELNEDSAFMLDYYDQGSFDRYLCLGAVADGMGGHQAGEIASRTAIKELFDQFENSRHRFRSSGMLPSDELIFEMFSAANNGVYELALRDDNLQGMGTTLVAFLAEENALHVGSVGDSRAYLLRNGSIIQLTVDHTLVEKMVLEGLISREEAETRPDRNVITRAIGVRQDVEVDIIVKQLLPDDVVLLCTDGLHAVLGEGDINTVVSNASDMQDAAETLVDMALSHGTNDNVTVLLWRMPKLISMDNPTVKIASPLTVDATGVSSQTLKMPIPEIAPTRINPVRMQPLDVVEPEKKFSTALLLVLAMVLAVAGFFIGWLLAGLL